MSTKKKVVIIGAGASGLAAIKCCLDEALEPICFEQTDHIGGLWCFTQEETNSSVYRSTIINTSKEMMSFSDFPIPPKFATFMHHSDIIEYFNMYMKHFGLQQYISFNTKVVSVEPIEDNYKQDSASSLNKKWRVATENAQTNAKETIEVEAVMVCSGHHWLPHKVHFEGIEKFKGTVIHSHAYKDHKPFEGKKTVVVGIGNSGVDVAVELSRHCPKTYLSTRSGSWIVSRITGVVPSDHLMNNRFMHNIPLSLRTAIAQKLVTATVGDPNIYPALAPKHSFTAAHPTINGELYGRIATGSLTPKPNIKRVLESAVEFEDGDVVEADAIVLCTGYKISFPFLSNTVLEVVDNKVDLHLYAIHPEFGKSLTFLGLVQPIGAIMPISEMQARYITFLVASGASLPSKQEMLNEIQTRNKEIQGRYKASPRHTIQTDYVTIMDLYAKKLGVYPDWKEYVKKGDLGFAWKLVTGPVVPQVYRLQGRGAWKDARSAFEKLYWNTLNMGDYKRYALESQGLQNKSATMGIVTWMLLFFVVLVAIFVYKMK